MKPVSTSRVRAGMRRRDVPTDGGRRLLLQRLFSAALVAASLHASARESFAAVNDAFGADLANYRQRLNALYDEGAGRDLLQQIRISLEPTADVQASARMRHGGRQIVISAGWIAAARDVLLAHEAAVRRHGEECETRYVEALARRRADNESRTEALQAHRPLPSFESFVADHRGVCVAVDRRVLADPALQAVVERDLDAATAWMLGRLVAAHVTDAAGKPVLPSRVAASGAAARDEDDWSSKVARAIGFDATGLEPIVQFESMTARLRKPLPPATGLR